MTHTETANHARSWKTAVECASWHLISIGSGLQCSNCGAITSDHGLTWKRPEMRIAVVKFSNGDIIKTNINGTDKEIQEYYAIGRKFNLGSVEDNMQSVVALEFE